MRLHRVGALGRKPSGNPKLDLQRGTIDMAFRDFTPTEYQSLQKQKGVTVHIGKAASIRYLVLNTKMAPTDNPAVRIVPPLRPRGSRSTGHAERLPRACRAAQVDCLRAAVNCGRSLLSSHDGMDFRR